VLTALARADARSGSLDCPSHPSCGTGATWMGDNAQVAGGQAADLSVDGSARGRGHWNQQPRSAPRLLVADGAVSCWAPRWHGCPPRRWSAAERPVIDPVQAAVAMLGNGLAGGGGHEQLDIAERYQLLPARSVT
jgi:hypothetical protein